MSIAPITKSLFVAVPPARAFEVFTRHIGGWWDKGKTVGAKPHVDVVMEPRAGGRWYEVDEDGAETPWGRVLVWEPPHRLVLAWQLAEEWRYREDFETEVEVRFTPEGDGTRVDFEHRNLERYGAVAEARAGQLGGGWPNLLANFARYAEEETIA